MRRTLTLSFLVVSVAAALAVGSYSTFASTGPVVGVATSIVGFDEPEVTDDVDEVDGDDGGKGARENATVIAEGFGASPEEVWALHEQGIGFGAIFKLYALGAPIPTDVGGEHEFNFGELRKALTEEQQAALESGPKNLGQLKKAARQAAGGGPESDGSPAAKGLEKAREKFAARAAEADGPKGHGPPESVPAHGRH